VVQREHDCPQLSCCSPLAHWALKELAEAVAMHFLCMDNFESELPGCSALCWHFGAADS
jgi:hypothetical protein